jgi:hypothetical protein
MEQTSNRMTLRPILLHDNISTYFLFTSVEFIDKSTEDISGNDRSIPDTKELNFSRPASMRPGSL